MNFRQLLAIASVGTIGIAGCDAGQFATGVQGGEVPVRVSAEVANAVVAGVAVEVTGPGIDNTIVANLPINEGMASGSVVVLAGSDRAFTLRAYDAQGLETHRGGDTLDIAADGTAVVDVAITPLVGDVEIDGRVGEYTITVTSPSPTIAVGQTVQLEATVVDSDGSTVPDAEVVWGSSNPAVARVASDGSAEALVVGVTTIGASYKGFSGTSSITVQ